KQQRKQRAPASVQEARKADGLDAVRDIEILNAVGVHAVAVAPALDGCARERDDDQREAGSRRDRWLRRRHKAAPLSAHHQMPSALTSSAAAPAYKGSDGATRRTNATNPEPSRSTASALTAFRPLRCSSIQIPPTSATTSATIATLKPTSRN